jgi:hypothetical protein
MATNVTLFYSLPFHLLMLEISVVWQYDAAVVGCNHNVMEKQQYCILIWWWGVQFKIGNPN